MENTQEAEASVEIRMAHWSESPQPSHLQLCEIPDLDPVEFKLVYVHNKIRRMRAAANAAHIQNRVLAIGSCFTVEVLSAARTDAVK